MPPLWAFSGRGCHPHWHHGTACRAPAHCGDRNLRVALLGPEGFRRTGQSRQLGGQRHHYCHCRRSVGSIRLHLSGRETGNTGRQTKCSVVYSLIKIKFTFRLSLSFPSFRLTLTLRDIGEWQTVRGNSDDKLHFSNKAYLHSCHVRAHTLTAGLRSEFQPARRC